MQILITGDTHIPDRAAEVPPDLLDEAAAADAVIHTGDFNSPEVYEQFAEVARSFFAVRGNRDRGILTDQLAREMHFQLADLHFALLHGDSFGRPRPSRLARHYCNSADVVVYGHLHRPFVAPFSGCTVINPGTPVEPRGSFPSYMRAHIHAGEISVKTVYMK